MIHFYIQFLFLYFFNNINIQSQQEILHHQLFLEVSLVAFTKIQKVVDLRIEVEDMHNFVEGIIMELNFVEDNIMEFDFVEVIHIIMELNFVESILSHLVQQ